MLEIVAIVLSPIIAIVVGNWISDIRERSRRRHQLFQALWLTRADSGSLGRLSPEHVRALNMIEIEFSQSALDEFAPERSTRGVLGAWRTYLAHLNRPMDGEPGSPAAQRWNVDRDNLLLELLYEIAQSLGYRFSRDDVRTGAYAPMGYLSNDLDGMAIRQAMRQVLEGDRVIRVAAEPRSPG